MAEYWAEWLMLVALMLTAAASPGPDLVLAIRNSLVYSRRAGLFTALGFGLGVSVHVTYGIIGISGLIAQSATLFTAIKYAGAAYLVWIGWKALRSRGHATLDLTGETRGRADLAAWAALRSGLVTNLLNAKAMLFFLALFTQILRPGLPIGVQIFYGLTCVTVVTAWFSFVATVLTDRRVRNRFLHLSKWIDRLCGGLLIALGVRIALSKAA